MRSAATMVLCAALALAAACKGRGGAEAPRAQAGQAAQEAPPPVPFAVRADASDLVFFWFDEQGTPHAVTRASEVPEARRGLVRVDPPRPDQRAPGWVYVADLRRADAQGAFPARSVRSEELGQQLLAAAGVTGPLGTQAPANAPAAAPGAQPAHGAQPAQGDAAPGVIVYGASWCSACHQAAGWLRAHNVPFVEKDIEQDPAAQQEMMAKAQRAGVPTGSIPILDVRGRILLGFSPPDIERALAGG